MKSHSELLILKKSTLSAIAMIFVTTTVFGVFIQSVKASELSKVEWIKTEYLAKGNQDTVSSDNFEIDCQVKLEEGSPEANGNAISAEEAAKVGIQDLKRIFDIDSKGKTINMYYSPIGETSVRAEWFGNVEGGGEISYYFSVDAVTGKISTTCRDIRLNKNVNLGFDKALLEDSSEYKERIKKVIEDYQILPEEIVSIEYVSQGYINDNPDIQFQAVDAKGNEAQFSFSRYDKKLLQVCYDDWVKMTRLLEEKLNAQLEE